MKKISAIFLFLALLLLAASPSFGRVYRVKRGDTLARIAKRYKTSVKRLERENGLTSSRLKPGRRLRIASAGRHERKLRRHHNRRIRRRLAKRTRHAARERERLAQETGKNKAGKEISGGEAAPEVEIPAPPASDVKAAAAEAPNTGGQAAPEAVSKDDKPANAVSLEAGSAGPGPDADTAKIKTKTAGMRDNPDFTPAVHEPDPALSGRDLPAMMSIATKPGLANSMSSSIVNSMISESAREDRIYRSFARRRPENVYHRVRRGETLCSIARHYGTTPRKLKKLNHIRARRSRLKPGQRLVVKVALAGRKTPQTYTIKRGDTFLKIAREFHLDAEKLEDINELDPSELRPGMKIRLVEAEAKDNSQAAVPDPRISAPQIEAQIKELEHSKTIESLSIKDRLLMFARTMMNIPYRFGGTSFYGIDCSAFVQKVFNLLDIPLPRTARQQYREGVPVSLEDLSIGDLVFFRTYASFPSHVGIYIGENLFIHASSGGHRVKIGSLKAPYFMKRIIGAKRLFSGQELPAGDSQ